MGAETAFPSIPTAVPLKAAIKHIVWAVQYVLIFVGLYTVASFSTGIHVESKVAISSSLTLGSILVTIQYLYGRWRQTQTSTDGDLSNSAKPPEQAAIPQSHAPVKPTERAAVASQSHATAAPTSRSAPTSLSDSNGQLPPSTKVASGGLSILVKPSEQAVNRLHGQPSSSTACRYPYYVAPDPLLFSLLGPPPPDLPPTRRGSGRGPPCDPPPSLSTSFLIPVRVESLQKPGNQFYYVGIPPLHFIHDRTTGRDFTLTAFFRLPLNRALREYHLNIAVAHIQAEFPLGMINEDWKPVLYERPQLIHYDGRQYFWDNISIKITPSGAVQYDLIVFYYRLGFPSRARDTICLGHDRSGHWKDEETGKPIKVGELDTQNTSMVKQILTPGGCRKVKVGPRLGVVFARSTDLEPEDYPAVKSATVFFGEWPTKRDVPISDILPCEFNDDWQQSAFCNFQAKNQGIAVSGLSWEDLNQVYNHHPVKILTPLDTISSDDSDDSDDSDGSGDPDHLDDSCRIPYGGCDFPFGDLNTNINIIWVTKPAKDRHQKLIQELLGKGFSVIVLSNEPELHLAWLPAGFELYVAGSEDFHEIKAIEYV